jgi:hypothetical protein
MYFYKLSFLLFVIGLNFHLHCQVEKVSTKDFNLDNSSAYYSCLLDENGVAMIRYLDDGASLDFKHVDSEFKEKYSVKIPIKKGYRLQWGQYSDDDESVMFLYKNDLDFIIITYNTKTFEQKTINGTFPSAKNNDLNNLQITFKKFDSNLIYYFAEQKTETVFCINLENGIVKKINFLENTKKTEIIKLGIIKEKGVGYISIKEYINKKKFIIKVFLFNSEGELLSDPLVLKDISDRNILDVSLSFGDKGKRILSGTYTFEESQLYSSWSNGIFLAEFENTQQNHINFYSLSDFNHFYEYYDDVRNQKVQERILKDRTKGKLDFVKALIKTHPVIYLNGTYTFIGEGFLPTYRDGGVNKDLFDGYTYTHAFILKLNDSEKIEYDKCIPMQVDYKPSYLTESLDPRISKDNLTLYYFFNNSFKTCIIDNKEAIEHNHGEIIRDSEEPNKKVKNSGLKFTYWYENYFISYGLEKIQNQKDNSYVLTKFNF